MLYRVIEKSDHWRIRCPATGWLRIPRDGRWSFNGDYQHPTFSPSLNQTVGLPGESIEQVRAGRVAERNHCFVRDGRIEYLPDCTHHLAGQTVELPPLTEAELSLHWPEVKQ